MSHCSSCGKYVGPYEACPYCGARQTGRTRVRTVKAAAVVLSTVGLVMLWLAATRAPIPLTPIGQVGATMNMAYARVEGQVVRGPTYYADSGYLAFTLADSTGEMRVSAYRNETEALRAQGRVPALGDWVSVAGTLQIRQENPSLTINVPEHMDRLHPELLLLLMEQWMQRLLLGFALLVMVALSTSWIPVNNHQQASYSQSPELLGHQLQ